MKLYKRATVMQPQIKDADELYLEICQAFVDVRFSRIYVLLVRFYHHMPEFWWGRPSFDDGWDVSILGDWALCTLCGLPGAHRMGAASARN